MNVNVIKTADSVVDLKIQYDCEIINWCRFQRDDGEVKYLDAAQELIRPERNTLTVSFADVEMHNQSLATVILEEYYR